VNNYIDYISNDSSGNPIRNTVAGTFPVSNELALLHPEIMAGYYDQSTAQTLMIAGVNGGVGYNHLSQLPAGDESTWLNTQVKPLMQQLGQNIMFVIDDGTTKQQSANGIVTNLSGFLKGLQYWQLGGTVSICGTATSAFKASDGTPCVVDTFAIYPGPNDANITAGIQTAASTCDFIQVMVNTTNGSNNPAYKAFLNAKNALGSNYTFVRLDQFFSLMKQAGLV
jgi:hypothetical protein